MLLDYCEVRVRQEAKLRILRSVELVVRVWGKAVGLPAWQGGETERPLTRHA